RDVATASFAERPIPYTRSGTAKIAPPPPVRPRERPTRAPNMRLVIGMRFLYLVKSAPFGREPGRRPGPVSAAHIDDVVSRALKEARRYSRALAPETVDDHGLRLFDPVHFAKELAHEFVPGSGDVSF